MKVRIALLLALLGCATVLMAGCNSGGDVNVEDIQKNAKEMNAAAEKDKQPGDTGGSRN